MRSIALWFVMSLTLIACGPAAPPADASADVNDASTDAPPDLSSDDAAAADACLPSDAVVDCHDVFACCSHEIGMSAGRPGVCVCG